MEPPRVHRLDRNDLALMSDLLSMFGAAVDDTATYDARRPGPEYLSSLLGSDSFVALAAIDTGDVVGGLAAYVLPKFDQERGEIYITTSRWPQRTGGAASPPHSSRRSARSAVRSAPASSSFRRTRAMRRRSRSTKSWAFARTFFTSTTPSMADSLEAGPVDVDAARSS